MSTITHHHQNAISRPMMLRRYRVIVESPDGSKTRPMSFNKWHNELFPGEWPKASIRQDTVTYDQERGDTRSSGWSTILASAIVSISFGLNSRASHQQTRILGTDVPDCRRVRPE